MPRASLETIQESQDEVYRSLCLMVGQDTDGSLTIAEIPSADISKIDGYDLESDTQKAIGNNYTLMSERHTSSGGTTSGVNNKKRNVAESEENLKIQMESLYNDILQKKQELKATVERCVEGRPGEKSGGYQIFPGNDEPDRLSVRRDGSHPGRGRLPVGGPCPGPGHGYL